MLVRVRRPRQVAVGAVILVGAVGVVLGVGRRRRRAVVLVRAGLDVAAVVFRHLRGIERSALRSDFPFFRFTFVPVPSQTGAEFDLSM